MGWAGILGGWSFGATDNAATAILNGHFAACAGLFGWMLVERIDKGHVTANGLVSGALAGLVAISASGALVGPGGAMAIGLIAAMACRLARSEEHTSELQSLMRSSYAVFCLKTKTKREKKQT